MWQSHLAYHPRIGYTYTPYFKGRLPHGSGGYLVRTNEAGFRSDRPFGKARESGSARMLVFGDSQTAGLGVSNGDRYTDLLEQLIPGLEVFNYGLDGTGPDQQYLAYEAFGTVQHDLLVIAPYVEDVERVNARYAKFIDEAGEEAYYPKPFFELKNDGLTLGHVPVPKAPVKKIDLPPETAGRANEGWLGAARPVFRSIAPLRLRRYLKEIGVHAALRRMAMFKAASGLDRIGGPRWRLFAKILETWIARSPAPVLLLPIPSMAFIEGSSDPTEYQRRISELAAALGCHTHDPLPDLRNHDMREQLAFYFRHDGHLSRTGHRAIAESTAPAVKRILADRDALNSSPHYRAEILRE